MAAPPWLVRNYGPRCTLVCAASVLRRLGIGGDISLVDAIAAETGFREGFGPPVAAYLGGHSALDRGIEQAALAGGRRVRSRTRFIVRWRDVVASLERGVPVVLNCYRAPSGQWSHSVLAVDCATPPRRLLTLDPNDGLYRWLTWLRPATGWICTATFIEPEAVADSASLSAVQAAAPAPAQPLSNGIQRDRAPAIPPAVQAAVPAPSNRAGRARAPATPPEGQAASPAQPTSNGARRTGAPATLPAVQAASLQRAGGRAKRSFDRDIAKAEAEVAESRQGSGGQSAAPAEAEVAKSSQGSLGQSLLEAEGEKAESRQPRAGRGGAPPEADETTSGRRVAEAEGGP